MTNPDYTHIAIIADRSGSMKDIAGDMNGAILQLLSDQAKLPGELHVDVTVFDSIVDVLYENVRADDVKNEIIQPRGVTALNDAVGSTIVRLGERFEALAEEDRPGKVLLVIVTDGHENASKEWKTADVKALVEKQRDQFSWEILFFGASSIDAFASAEAFGIQRGQTMSYDASDAGTQVFAAAASGYATRSRLSPDAPVEFTEAERAGFSQ